MELASKNNAEATTPGKETHGSRSKNKERSKQAENSNPNVYRGSPGSKSLNSPVTKSAKSLKSASKNPNQGVCMLQNKVRQRKFVTAKKNPKKKEEFCKNQADEENQSKGCDGAESLMVQLQDLRMEEDGSFVNETESPEEVGISTVKRRRDKLLEEARRSVPEGGSGKVMHLVKAFEKLLTIPTSKKCDQKEDEKQAVYNNKKAMQWALPGLKLPPKAPETEVSSSSFCPSDLFLTSENLGLDPRISLSSSWDNSSRGSRSSTWGQRSRRNSLESSGTSGGRRRKKKHPKPTSQKPFRLRTEQRGKLKEEEFMKKIQEVMIEEEKQRIPIAQGLPWTTEEPENLVKPAIKEITRPIDLKLHSDLRAIDRAEFDFQVAEKLSFVEQYKMERGRQQKLAEEEEIRRLRKELIPKAQPMPYFDRPFIPRRSMKHPTIPKEPKFQILQAQNKKDQALLIME